jgi:hypothetical protein
MASKQRDRKIKYVSKLWRFKNSLVYKKPLKSRAPSKSTGTLEFLELKFKKKVFPSKIEVYETYNPGSLVKISAMNENKKWVTLWKGKREKQTISKSRIFKPKLKEIDFQTNLIRLDIDTNGSSSFYEIDAVRLIGEEEEGEKTEEGENEEEEKENKTKKEKSKKSKTKRFNQSQLAYSRSYENLYNNPKFSDVKIKFEGSGEIMYCHKLILESTSECKNYK